MKGRGNKEGLGVVRRKVLTRNNALKEMEYGNVDCNSAGIC
jgi:hypothetical protein